MSEKLRTAEELLEEKKFLLEEWDTKYATTAHYIIDTLLSMEKSSRNRALQDLAQSVGDFVKHNGQKVAGAYETLEFQLDILREVILRARARQIDSLPVSNEVFVDEYKALESKIYSGGYPPVNFELIAKLKSGESGEDVTKYLEGIGKICDFIFHANVEDKEQRIKIEEAIYLPARVLGTKDSFPLEGVRNRRMREDVVLNLIGRLPNVENPAKTPTDNWLNVLSRPIYQS